MTWPPPEPEAGAALGLNPLLAGELALGEAGELGRAGADFTGLAVRDGTGLAVRVPVPDDDAGFPVACAAPGRVRATAPAVMTLAAVTVVVTERILA